MRHKPDMTESKTDLDALSMGVSGQQTRNGHGETDDLAREILEERRNRLRKQNKKLDFEIELKEQQYGDIAQLKRDVLRANAVVKQSPYALIHRVSEELVQMTEAKAIEAFLHAELTQCFNDLAYEHGRIASPDE